MSIKKTYLTVVTVVVLLSVAVPLLVLHKPWKGTKVATSELYNRYADKEGIEASFIKDYKVNDSVFVDVTLLEATTDSAWEVLLKDFNMPDIPKEVVEMGVDMFVKAVNRKDYSLPADSILVNNDVMMVSYALKTISVFRTETLGQMWAVNHSKYEEMINNENN